ncbi:uncharacterized protein LOC124812516 [Hydra vulgaris]|uniref:uncharacterized protein LOC124812516 n=1 Tax=Hydra vulgaris TaxID=6087 RepID=UPI0032EA2BD2
MDCTNYLNGLVPCRKHILKDIGSELAHHLQGCLPDETPSIRKKFYCHVTVLLKQSYPNCTFGEIMDEFERMNIITKESEFDKLMQVVEKLYPGMPIASALIKFHSNTTRRGVLCPVVIAGDEDISFSPGPQLILGENVRLVDKGNIIAIGQRHNDALHVLQLLAYYYIMDLSYSRSFGGVLGLL